jgi:hypothetical protein
MKGIRQATQGTDFAYEMLYINMATDPWFYGDPIQNKRFQNAILWLGSEK